MEKIKHGTVFFDMIGEPIGDPTSQNKTLTTKHAVIYAVVRVCSKSRQGKVFAPMRIAERLDMSQRSLRRHLADLEFTGYITCERNDRGEVKEIKMNINMEESR